MTDASEETILKVQTTNLDTCSGKDILFYETNNGDCRKAAPCTLVADEANEHNYCTFSCKCSGICYLYVGFKLSYVGDNRQICEVQLV